MRGIKTIIVCIALTWSLDAHATLGRTCEFDPALDSPNDPTPEYPFHDPQTIIPVYTSFDDPPWVATGVDQATFEFVLEKALAIENEQLGTTIRMRYIGARSTPASGFVDNAVIVYGSMTSCHNTNPYYAGTLFHTKLVGPHLERKWFGASIVMLHSLGCPADDPANFIHWTTVEAQNFNHADIGFALMHELGCGTRVMAITENARWRSPKTRDGDHRKRGITITENAHRDRRSDQSRVS